MAPFVIPGIVLAIGFYAAYAPPPLALYGTATILILAYTTRFLPIAYTSSAAGMRSINPEMEEAVRILPKPVTRPREHTLHEDAAEPARGRGSARRVEHDDVAASPPDEFESENAVLRVSLAPGRRP